MRVFKMHLVFAMHLRLDAKNHRNHFKAHPLHLCRKKFLQSEINFIKLP